MYVVDYSHKKTIYVSDIMTQVKKTFFKIVIVKVKDFFT